MEGSHNCQLSAHVPALPTASGTQACWQVLSAISPLTSIAYSIRNPCLLAGTHNCQLSAHLQALPTASGTPVCWQVLTIVSYQPTYQNCLQHQGPQPVGRYSQLSAISPLTSIAYSIRSSSLFAGTHNFQLSAHLPTLPTASEAPACWPVLIIVSYQPTYQHCLQHQEPQPVGRNSQLSAISPLTSIAYSIRDPSLLAGTHNCQLSAHLPALLTASEAPAYWQVLIIFRYQPIYQHCLQHQGPQFVGRYSQLSAISPLTSIAYSIRDPSLLALPQNCQLSAHLKALPKVSGQPTYQHCLQHHKLQPIGRY